MERAKIHSNAWKHWAAGAAVAISAVLAGVPAVPVLAQAAAGDLTSEWVDGHASRVRMIAGRDSQAVPGKPAAIIAGVEIDLQPGWKTYWRSPGEAGGVPPDFDWSKSKNVADAKVVFPAPKRLTDAAGDSIGYKDNVVLPVIVTPADASKPVELALEFAFGVCRDICIPAEARLALDVPQSGAQDMPEGLKNALDQAPRKSAQKQPGDPELTGHEIVLAGKAPRVVLDIDFGASPDMGDVFAEAPGGLFLPMPRRVEGAGKVGGSSRFEIDLTQTLDFEDLKGKTIRLTLVGADGQSERELVLK
ncbi:MAG: hypothetical protein KJ587_03230 [Alphaproteobacteria bacterium]|nr:hypothetical protein [Alphaproteobacteria bacterium]